MVDIYDDIQPCDVSLLSSQKSSQNESNFSTATPTNSYESSQSIPNSQPVPHKKHKNPSDPNALR